MIVIDSEFNQVNNNANYNNIYNIVIEYLNSIISDNKILKDMFSDNEYIIVQETLNNEYTIKLPDGSIKKNAFPSSSAALKANMVIGLNKDVLGIRPGIVLRPNFLNHQLVHELIHAISSTQINRFNNDGITYTKVGLKIDYFDNNLNNYININNISSDGLNEGVTEYLTSIITNEFTGQYPTMVIIAKLLMSPNNYLINAFFSKDLNEFEKFYTDLEEKQSIIKKDDLINFSSKDIDEDNVARIIAGAINYNKAYNCELDNTTYDWIIYYLDNYHMLDSGSWNDLIKKYLNEKKIY